MKRMMKRIVSLFLCFCMLFTLASCGGNNATNNGGADEDAGNNSEPIVLKLGHADADTTTDGQIMLLLAERVKERSNGELEILVYGGEQLGSATAQQESVQLGTLDITVYPDNTFSGLDSSLFGIASIPYLFQDNEAFTELIMNTGLADEQARVLRENNMVVLNTERNYFKGPWRVICSKKPIETLEDFQGLRFRAFENKQYIEAYDILGANPLVVAWGETYSALQQGTVEACAGNFSQIRGMGFTAEAPYVIRTNEYYSNILFVMNADKYESLSDEHKQILHDCINELHVDLEELQEASVEEDIKWMEENHNAVFTDLDTAPIREALRGYYESLEEEGILPPGTVEAAFAEE